MLYDPNTSFLLTDNKDSERLKKKDLKDPVRGSWIEDPKRDEFSSMVASIEPFRKAREMAFSFLSVTNHV